MCLLNVMSSRSGRGLAVIATAAAHCRCRGRGVVFGEAFGLPDEGALQDDATFFVALRVLSREFVDPTQFGVAIFAGNVTHHVATSEHDSVLDVAEGEVDDFVEEEGSSGGAGEPRGNEFASVGQIRVTTHAREQPASAHVVQEDATHDVRWSRGSDYVKGLVLMCNQKRRNARSARRQIGDGSAKS